MKKVASILLILLLTTTFLYNVIGFHLLYSLQKEQSWVSNTVTVIPNSEYKILKLNASLYSFIEDEEMQYVSENISIKNNVYHVFKKEIKDNIIYLYYLPNKFQTNADLALKKLVDNDIYENSALNKKPLEKLFKSLIKDYVALNSINYHAIHINYSIKKINTDFISNKLHSGYLLDLFSPPKAV